MADVQGNRRGAGKKPTGGMSARDVVAEGGSAPVPARTRRVAVAAVLGACCAALIVVSLGFVHPGPDGSWSLSWLFQTVDTPGAASGSGERSGEGTTEGTDGDSDAATLGDAAARTEPSGAGDASSSPDAPVSNSTTEDAGTSGSPGAAASQGDASSQGGSAPSAGNAGSSTGSSSSPSGGDAEVPQTVTIRVSVDSSRAGNPVSASGTHTFPVGATAFDALAALGLSYNASQTQFGVYVSAIGGLAEKEHGATSGWLYLVNGAQPAMSASSYQLSDGDVVEWVYTV